ELRVESFSERTVTQQHEVPRCAARGFRLLSIFRVSSDQSRKVLLFNESRRSEEVILRQAVLFSDICLLTSDLLRLLAEILVIHYIVASKNPLPWHGKLNEIFNVALTA